jgi:glucokinase
MTDEALLIDVSDANLLRLTVTRPRQRPEPSVLYPCRTVADFSNAVKDYLSKRPNPDLIGAAVCACGWEQDGGLAMPNDPFRVQRDWLRELLNIRRLNLVNDCVSVAMSVQLLRPDETLKICGDNGQAFQAKLLIGASVGLGSALIISDDLNGDTVVPSEGGHSDLPAVTPRETAILELMKQKYGRVSRERAVSFQGLAEIWRCLCLLDRVPEEPLTGPDVIGRARSGDARARETVDLVTGWLAATASDGALMCGARGGVYLAGSMVAMMHDLIDFDLFTKRFQDKGRLRAYVTDLPVHMIIAPEPEMLGLSTLFS